MNTQASSAAEELIARLTRARRWLLYTEGRLAYERDQIGEQSEVVAQQFDFARSGQVPARGEWLTVTAWLD